jgi:hypothetical protein
MRIVCVFQLRTRGLDSRFSRSGVCSLLTVYRGSRRSGGFSAELAKVRRDIRTLGYLSALRSLCVFAKMRLHICFL